MFYSRFAKILALVMIFIPLVAATQASPRPANPLEKAILTTLDNYFVAVNEQNPKKFLTFFVPTEDLTVIEDKDIRESRKAFVEFIDGFFKEVSEIKATWEARNVHPLSPEIAVVTGIFRVVAKDSKKEPMVFRNAFTFVLVKKSERWLVKHVHESTLEL